MKYTLTYISFIIALVMLQMNSLVAQEAASTETTPTIQPTIMAIPYVGQGQSTRRGYDYSEINRIAITKVKEAFDDRGVNTIDFRAKLKQLQNSEALTEDQEYSIKDEVIKISGADIYVEVEASKNYSKTGNSVTVIMTAYDAFSAESLANKVATSPKFNTDNYEKLTQKAVEQEIDNLLNTIQDKFTMMVDQGRTITMEIGIEAGSEIDFDFEPDDSGMYLSEIVEEWMADNAKNGYFHTQGTSATKMIFDIVKIPLKDEKGRNYRVSKFVSELRKYFKSLDVKADRTIVGNAVTITLDQL